MNVTIKITHGDLLKQHDVDAIVNTVNCVGVMGKGIALQFKNKWPENFRAYVAACRVKKIRPGQMFVFNLSGLAKPSYIINFPTKDHWRGPSSMEFIRSGLVDLVTMVKQLGIRSIAIPPLGCGNGGLEWDDVRPLIEAVFASVPEVEVRLFEPGTNLNPKQMDVQTHRPAMTAGRAAILKVLETYRALGYGLSRVEAQKLAYFLQEAGEELNLAFIKHKYGPYSEKLRHALNRMEGHFIRGVGDGTVESEIEPLADATNEANMFIEGHAHLELAERVSRVARLIDGFQTPYGMELLSSVHWVATHELQSDQRFEQILHAVHAWNARKATLMQSAHVRSAMERLTEQGWMGLSRDTKLQRGHVI